jgi:hypothetical protein
MSIAFRSKYVICYITEITKYVLNYLRGVGFPLDVFIFDQLVKKSPFFFRARRLITSEQQNDTDLCPDLN